MEEFIICLLKYTALFMCILYAYSKLLRIKLKAWDLLDIPIFLALSAVLYFITVYIKILVPIGFLIFGIVFLFLRFKKTFYETVTVGTIALGISIVISGLAIVFSFPIAFAFYPIKNDFFKNIIGQFAINIIQIVCMLLLFKNKRLRSGVNPKGETATFEILLFFSVGCIFTMMLYYTKNANKSVFENVLLVIALFGLLLLLWWRRHITYSYREAVKQRNVNRMEDTIEEYRFSSVEAELQVAVYAKLFHYLNKAVPDCALLAENAAAQTDCADACAARDMLQRILREMHLANEKCSLQSIPQTGVRLIDMPILRLFAAAENKNFRVSADISADVERWFVDDKLQKDEIHILLTYLIDNAAISALGSISAKVRVELGETLDSRPRIRIYDSGEPFDEEVISKLGLEQITTRAGVGGNGIGLFTVFEILTKYGASFMLDEAPPNGFTKCIEIAFDGRHSLTVRTSRKSVAAACAARKDMTILLAQDIAAEALHDGTNG